MVCIICFLQDDLQESLRNKARTGHGRFEDAISEYGKIFNSLFWDLEPASKCGTHKDAPEPTLKWCDDLNKCLTEIGDIEEWISEIRKSYVFWISGEYTNAAATLESAIDCKNIFANKISISSDFAFSIRARKSSGRLAKKDLFHIPFDKRNLISNQRYSINGSPMLYLGQSVTGVIREIRAQDTPIEEVSFSAFVMRSPSSLRIANLTNRFPSLYSTFKTLHEADSEVSFDDGRWGNLAQDCINGFYTYILASCCAFRTSGADSTQFKEEYVIPQLLSERARSRGFHGIAYSSVQSTRDVCFSNTEYFTNKYRENLVLFTKYSAEHLHDNGLIDNFDISDPIRLSECTEVTFDDLDALRKKITSIHNQNPIVHSLALLAQYTGVHFQTHFGGAGFSEGGSVTPYIEHPHGKIHAYLIYQQMLSFINKLNSQSKE